MIKIYPYDQVDKKTLFFRGVAESGVGDIVTGILENVRQNGDKALLEYAKKFDKAELSDLEVSPEEIEAAFAQTDPKLLRVMERAAENIRAFHSQQLRSGFEIKKENGVILGQKVTPIEKVGLYIPGGTASYPSTVLMNAIPAKLAGCR